MNHVRTLTAEGGMSARILTAIPLGMALWQWKVNPDHFALLFHGAGLVALIVAGILMALGAAIAFNQVTPRRCQK